jgi:molybdopterin-containing oxidoreductase family iron-sulfur binding subunit
MGVIYFGDVDEDTVTNGTETFQFSQLIRDRAGYRYLETLGTRPCVYYLPPVDRQFPVDRGFSDLTEDVKDRYKDTPYSKKNNP